MKIVAYCKCFPGENRGTFSNVQKGDTRHLKEILLAVQQSTLVLEINAIYVCTYVWYGSACVFIHNIRSPFLAQYSR